MDFYNEIRNKSTEEIKEIVQRRIDKLTEEKNQNEKDTFIGYELDHNPTEFYITEDTNTEQFGINIRCLYPGFLKKGMKVIYGMSYDYNGIASNDGRYYYLDDDSYLEDFVNYIKDIEIIDEYELMDYILEFIRDYFGYLKQVEREDMFQLLCDSNGKLLKPTEEHGISWFKGKGNAMCSEYAVVAQNILSLFDIECYLVIGKIKIAKEKAESHAYNIVVLEDNEKEVPMLVDFADYTPVLDITTQKIGESPFISYIDQFDEEFVDKLINQEEHLTFNDYAYIIIGNELIQALYERKRDYYIETNLEPDEVKKYSKTNNYSVVE